MDKTKDTTTVTLELTELEARALRASINWTKSLVFEGKLDLYDWQAEALEKINEELR